MAAIRWARGDEYGALWRAQVGGLVLETYEWEAGAFRARVIDSRRGVVGDQVLASFDAACQWAEQKAACLTDPE